MRLLSPSYRWGSRGSEKFTSQGYPANKWRGWESGAGWDSTHPDVNSPSPATPVPPQRGVPGHSPEPGVPKSQCLREACACMSQLGFSEGLKQDVTPERWFIYYKDSTVQAALQFCDQNLSVACLGSGILYSWATARWTYLGASPKGIQGGLRPAAVRTVLFKSLEPQEAFQLLRCKV